MFNDFWMRDNGFLNHTPAGDLSDIVIRRFSDHEVEYLKPDDLIKNAYQKMKLYEISQIPVVEGTSVVGIIDESDVLEAIISKEDSFQTPVKEVMSSNLVTLSPKDKIGDIIKILLSGMVPIVVDREQFIGLITKIDLINYLNKNKITVK